MYKQSHGNHKLWIFDVIGFGLWQILQDSRGKHQHSKSCALDSFVCSDWTFDPSFKVKLAKYMLHWFAMVNLDDENCAADLLMLSDITFHTLFKVNKGQPYQRELKLAHCSSQEVWNVKPTCSKILLLWIFYDVRYLTFPWEINFHCYSFKGFGICSQPGENHILPIYWSTSFINKSRAGRPSTVYSWPFISC